MTTNDRRARVLAMAAVTLGINGLLGMDHPLPIVAYFSIPASVICGGIAFRRGAERFGGIGISLGAIGFLLHSLLLVTSFQRLASHKPDPKGDLIRSLNEIYSKQLAEGKHSVPLVTDEHYLYSYYEEEAQTTSALTFRLVRGPFGIGDGGGTPLRFTRIEDKKMNSSKIYSSNITKEGDSYALVVTDPTNNEVIQKNFLPTAKFACEPAGQFDSVRACINEFNYHHKGAHQSQANRTCDNHFAALKCCVNDGSTYSVYLITPPSDRLCQRNDLVPATVFWTER